MTQHFDPPPYHISSMPVETVSPGESAKCCGVIFIISGAIAVIVGIILTMTVNFGVGWAIAGCGFCLKAFGWMLIICSRSQCSTYSATVHIDPQPPVPSVAVVMPPPAYEAQTSNSQQPQSTVNVPSPPPYSIEAKF